MNIFLSQNIFSPLSQVKSAGNDTLPPSIPNIGVFLTMATTSYASMIYYNFLHVASAQINEAKYFIISHIAYRYTCMKNTVTLVYSFIIRATFD